MVIESAGFVGQGRRSPELAAAVADGLGVGLRGHTSRLIDAGMVRAADLVVVMEPGQRRAMLRRFGTTRVLLLGDLDPEDRQGRTIRDPMWQSRETFVEVYGRIDRCVERLAELVSRTMA
jgi:protein-tyrosine-phosphatase